MIIKPLGEVLPENLRGVYDEGNDALRLNERNPLCHKFEEGQMFDLSREFVEKMKGFAPVAHFIVSECGMLQSPLGLDVSVNRKFRWGSSDWHRDERLVTRELTHRGRVTVSNTLSTLVLGGSKEPADFELVPFYAHDSHRAQNHEGATLRTWVTVTYGPRYPFD